MRSLRIASLLVLCAVSILAHATVFATLHGIVHDPHHRPIAAAQVTLQAAESTFALHTTTAANGTFEIPTDPHRRLSALGVRTRLRRLH